MLRYLILAVVLLLFLGGTMPNTYAYAEDGDGIVVILSGPSGAGKTSIQEAMQKKADRLFLRIGIDSFFDSLLPEPDLSRLQEDKRIDQETPLGEYIRGISLEQDALGQPVIPLHIGPAGDRVMRGMHRAIAAYAKAGNHLIVDYILYKDEYLGDLILSLEGLRVYWVGIFAPLEVIEQRERSRGTSPIGHARSHYHRCHQNIPYDLELNAAEATPEELADTILAFLRSQTQ